MDFFDYIINKNAAQKENPGKLSSYREAAELICKCWDKLDMSFIEPYLDENVVWKGGVPYRVINGKENYLKLMDQVFESLQYSKKNYRADVVMMNEYYACITIDGEYEDLAHRITIEDGLIKEIWITESWDWSKDEIRGQSPFGVIGVDTGGGDFLNILSTGNVHLKRNRFVTMMPLFMVMWILMGLQIL